MESPRIKRRLFVHIGPFISTYLIMSTKTKYMMANDLIKLQSSLTDAIGAWFEATDTDTLDTHHGEHTAELMAASAFNILLTQRDLTEYLRKENITDI